MKEKLTPPFMLEIRWIVEKTQVMKGKENQILCGLNRVADKFCFGRGQTKEEKECEGDNVSLIPGSHLDFEVELNSCVF